MLAAKDLDRFSELAAGFVARGEVPGVVALAARGDQVHTEAFGSLSLGGPPVREDSIFRVGSTTKPMTGVATLALVAEGLLSLDEPVDRLLPELANRRVLRRMDGPLDDTVPAQRAITVRDLLTFTFGFGSSGAMQMWPERFPVVAATERALHLPAFVRPDPACPLDPDAWIAALASLPLIAQPGERWLYNSGAAVLGVLLARAAGQPLAEVLRTRVFEPLGMRDTGFWTSQPDRMATAYQRSRKAGFTVLDECGRDWSKPPAFCDGAIGLITTAGDLLAFSRMLLRGGSPVLPADAVTEMTSDQLTPEQKSRIDMGKSLLASRSWGFCTFVVTGGPDAGSFGMGGFFGTSWLVNPALDLTVIVMTQRELAGGRLPKTHLDLQTAARSASAQSASAQSASAQSASAQTASV
jgi:CubicO group peptidase (beta-lactamase class C family)